MKPVFQTRFGGLDDPIEERGDCMRAAIASIFELELEDVPDLPQESERQNRGWYPILNEWLAERNLLLLQIPWEHQLMGSFPRHMIIGGESPRINGGHVIVVDTHSMVGDDNWEAHDPNPKGTGELGDPKEIWLFVALDPSKQKSHA